MKVFNDKKAKNGLLGLALVLIAVVFIGTTFAALMFGLEPFKQDVTSIDPDTGAPITGSAVAAEIVTFRSNNPSVDLEARVEDSLATGDNGLNATIVIIDLLGGNIVTNTIDTADEGTTRDTFTNAIKAGTRVEIGIITTQDTINSNRASFKTYATHPDTVDSSTPLQHTLQDPVKYDASTTKFAPLNCRAKDEIADARVDNGTGTDTTVFNPIGKGEAVNFTSTTTSTALDIDATDTFKYLFECQTDTADTQFGESTGLFIDHLDTDETGDDFQLVPVVSYEGTDIPDTLGAAAVQDRIANSNSDVFYNFGVAIDDSIRKFIVEMKPNSGEDPDNVITFKLVGAAITTKSGDVTQLIGRDSFVAYNTDQARTQLATATNNVFTVPLVAD